MKKIFTLIIICLLLLYSCKTSNISNSFAFKEIYQSGSNSINANVSFSHVNDSTSFFYLQLDTTNLHFTNLSLNTTYKYANIECKIEIFDTLDKILTYKNFNFEIVDTINSWDTLIELKINNDFKGYCKVYLRSNKNTFSKFIDIDKSNPYSNEWFQTNLKNNHLLFIGDTLEIKHLIKNIDTFKCIVYELPPIAAPPFAVELNNKNIELTKIKELQISATNPLVANRDLMNTLVSINIDTTPTGIFFIIVPEYFPEIKYQEELIPPIRYITSETEFNKLKNSANPKKAVDSFWLAQIGDIRRATEIIKKYYLRVINANRYFTDIQPGWQTDRGLIYIVQGQPNYIYRTYNTEVWLYGSRDEMYSKSYYFYRTKISNNFFTWKLFRNIDYKPFWFHNVNLWRK
ncbi:MAG TPA: GWxTD domain-containing protein [Bacteroidales bacterium]|nr:GWxTD domain-containing protein [Bacteroidales bacterium]HQD34068.1 GWxTD domain-containing protein [Bacteroidales bacterium]